MSGNNASPLVIPDLHICFLPQRNKRLSTDEDKISRTAFSLFQVPVSRSCEIAGKLPQTDEFGCFYSFPERAAWEPASDKLRLAVGSGVLNIGIPRQEARESETVAETERKCYVYMIGRMKHANPLRMKQKSFFVDTHDK